MKRRLIHRGGILSAGYDARARHLDVEFDTHRLVRVENIGPEAADRFLNSGSPAATGATSSRRATPSARSPKRRETLPPQGKRAWMT